MLVGAGVPPGLEPDHFYKERHRVIFDVLRELDRADALVLTEELRRRRRLRAAGGKAYIHELAASVPAAGNAESYAALILESARLRQLQTIGHELLGLSNSNGQASGLLQRVRELLEPPAARSKLERLDVAEMVRESPPEIPWRAEPILADGVLTMLFGPPGKGKSLYAAVLAAGVAVGEDVAGVATRKGTVLYIDAENGKWEIHRRVRSLGLPTEGVEIYEAAGDFDLRRDGATIERTVSAHQANVLILDSLRSLAPGLDENDSAECEAALGVLRRLCHDRQLSALLIHHANKGGLTYRGSSALDAAVDLMYLLAPAEGDPDRERRYIENRKMRIAAEPPRQWLRLSAEGGMVLLGEAEPYESDPADREHRAPVQQQLTPRVLEVLDSGPHKLAHIARAVGKKPKDRSVRLVLTNLAKAGHANRREDGLWERCKGVDAPRGADTFTPSSGGGGDDGRQGESRVRCVPCSRLRSLYDAAGCYRHSERGPDEAAVLSAARALVDAGAAQWAQA